MRACVHRSFETVQRAVLFLLNLKSQIEVDKLTVAVFKSLDIWWNAAKILCARGLHRCVHTIPMHHRTVGKALVLVLVHLSLTLQQIFSSKIITRKDRGIVMDFEKA